MHGIKLPYAAELLMEENEWMYQEEHAEMCMLLNDGKSWYGVEAYRDCGNYDM